MPAEELDGLGDDHLSFRFTYERDYMGVLVAQGGGKDLWFGSASVASVFGGFVLVIIIICTPISI